MKPPLKTTLKNKLGDKQLTSDQLQALFDLQKKYIKPSTISAQKKFVKPQAKRPYAVTLYAIAASIMLVFGGLFVYHTVSTSAYEQTQEQIFIAIADEVVNNHLHLKPLEVSTQNINEIQRYFNRLNFRPVNSQYMNTITSLNLLGARYCSIQGVTAAQLRFENTKNKTIQTLYEVPYDVNIFKYIPDIGLNEIPISLYSKGIKVTLWQEKGILFALTSE